MEKKRVQVLYLGSIQRRQDHPNSDKATDQIDFGKPTKVALIRIPKLKRQLYGKLTSITQSEPIKNFEIYFRNLEETGGRYSLLTSNSELMATSTSDILITPTVPFVTDLLVLRGVFSCLSLCVYGQLLEEAALWGRDGAVGEEGSCVSMKRDIWLEKRDIIGRLQAQVEVLERGGCNLSMVDSWQEVANDDDINEPQIKTISNISQHLLNTFQQINDDTYIVKFRENVQNINNMLLKLFKAKQIGLYYNKDQNYQLQNQIPLPLAQIGLDALQLLPSDQLRVLQMLKMLAQLPRHATTIIERGGVAQLCDLFLSFYQPNAMIFSTFKNLVLQVCIALSQWPTAAQRMVTKLQQDKYIEMGQPIVDGARDSHSDQETLREKPKDKGKNKDKDKSKGASRSRSRDKSKQKRGRTQSPSDDSQSEKDRHKKDKSKKDKKDKKKKDKNNQRPRDKSKGKDDKKKRDRSKEREEKREKEKRKEKEKEKQREDSKPRSEQSEMLSIEKKQSMMKNEGLEAKVKVLSFYELLFFVMLSERNSKTLNLVKILAQQIVQTLTKDKDISEQLALVTSFLRDTKYLFNQGTEIINAKSLKTFATFQPFLNEIQSQNVDCPFIAEKEKLKNPLKYGINPKTFMILSQINKAIVTHSSKNGRAFGTAFNEDFMVMMSQLIFEKEKPILSGFTRIVASFKAEGLMLLQRHEAAISIIAQYVYKALLDDEGLNTLLYLDQIHGSLIKFISFLNEDPSLFSTELKSRVKLLSNYATPYDHFSRSDGVFKVFCEYFLKLFKYENYEIEINNKGKITDFRKKEYQKLMNPFSFENLTENYDLKNFNEVSSSQPLLEVDVCLKIFLVLCDYNKNIWTTFYENKLVNGLSSLLNKVSNLMIFFLSQSSNRWTTYAAMKNYLGTLDNYLSVVKHALMLMAKKCRYESAYNDLLEDDIFEDVQLYEKSIEIFITLYNALNDNSLMVYVQKSRNKMTAVLALVIKIFDNFLTSFELVGHQTREAKFSRLLQHLFIKHYSEVNSRAAILAIYAQIVKISEGNTSKFLLHHFLEKSFTLNKLQQKEVAYVPTTDSIMENLLRTNIFRTNPLITNNLSLLLKNLFSKTSMFDRTLDIIDRLFQNIDEIAKKDEEEMGQIGWIALRKAHLFSEVLVQTGVVFKSRLDDRLMRFFKRLVEGYRKRYEAASKSDKKELQNFVIFLKTKNNFMQYFGLLVKENIQNTIFLNFYEMTSKALNFEFFNFSLEDMESIDELRVINSQVLRSCRIYLQSLAEVGLHAYYQCLLLYGEILQKPYKPQTFLSFESTLSTLEGLLSQHELEFNIRSEIHQIVLSIFLFLANLTSIDGENLFTTESRRLAIISLIASNDKEFPFKAIKSSNLFRLIPKELISLLQQFFNYPIVEKPIILGQKVGSKAAPKPKMTIYSKSVFNIISEHEPVSKTRYKYIGGEWLSGDIQKSLYSPFKKRSIAEQIQKTLLKKSSVDYEQYHCQPRAMFKQQVSFNDLFYLTQNKSKQDVPKKEIDKTIQLKDVIPKTTPQEIRRDPLPAVTPSPSRTMGADKRGPGSGYGNNTMMAGRDRSSRSPVPADRQYNRNSNPRSSSQTNPNIPPASYSSPPKYYDPRSNIGQPRTMQSPGQHPGYSSHLQPPSTYYPPNPISYDNRFYMPQGGHQGTQGHQQQRYGAPGSYGPPPPQVYMNPQQPMSRGAPMGGIYPSQAMPAGYVQPPMSHLNQYQEQLFNQAFMLLNQIKTSGLSEGEMTIKKNRLNQILSTHPKVHQKLKASLPQKS